MNIIGNKKPDNDTPGWTLLQSIETPQVTRPSPTDERLIYQALNIVSDFRRVKGPISHETKEL
jgi:hypothetical protein